MAFLHLEHIAVRGISAAVPAHTVEIRDLYKPEWGSVEEFIQSTTIERLHTALPEQTTSDLCVASAERLIADLGWEKQSIEALVFVTQTPDYYFVPATACHLQHRLGLPTSCLAFDVTLGCSGFTYGLTILASLMQSGAIKRGLLLAGDTCSRAVNPNDKADAPLFGSAGSACCLEYDPQAEGLFVNHFTDGEGYKAIITEKGGYREPLTAADFPSYIDREGNQRIPFTEKMDGMDVYAFAISQVPKNIKALMEHFELKAEDINMVALHQSNKMITQTIVRKIKCVNAFYPQSMRDFGNTSSASIPLSLVTEGAERLQHSQQRLLMSGYGVGLSIGTVYCQTQGVVVPPLVLL